MTKILMNHRHALITGIVMAVLLGVAIGGVELNILSLARWFHIVAGVFWIGGGTITWSGELDTDHAAVAAGYIAVTPLHLASAYAAMVNGGIWRPATLEKIAPGQAPAGRRVFKASSCRWCRSRRRRDC